MNRRNGAFVRHGLLLALAGLLAACATSPPATAPRPPPALPDPQRESARIDPVAPPTRLPGSGLPSGPGNPPFYEVMGERYHVLTDADGYAEQGIASWYGREFHGRRTSNGEIYDMYALTAAHKTLPLPSTARVTNLTTGKSVIVRVNDRGPFKKGRLIDLSYGAARELGFLAAGTAMVAVEVLSGAASAASTRDDTVVRRMYVQVGAFGQQGNAEGLKRRLESQGFSNVVIRYDAAAAGAPYRVRIGPVADASEYDAVVQRMSRLNMGEGRLVVETAAADGNAPTAGSLPGG